MHVLVLKMSDLTTCTVQIQSCWSTFKYFIILIVSANYIVCISWKIKCLIVIDARCKYDDFKLTVFVSSVVYSQVYVTQAHC